MQSLSCRLLIVFHTPQTTCSTQGEFYGLRPLSVLVEAGQWVQGRETSTYTFPGKLPVLFPQKIRLKERCKKQIRMFLVCLLDVQS